MDALNQVVPNQIVKDKCAAVCQVEIEYLPKQEEDVRVTKDSGDFKCDSLAMIWAAAKMIGAGLGIDSDEVGATLAAAAMEVIIKNLIGGILK